VYSSKVAKREAATSEGHRRKRTSTSVPASSRRTYEKRVSGWFRPVESMSGVRKPPRRAMAASE
jgi:hypothetical protein